MKRRRESSQENTIFRAIDNNDIQALAKTLDSNPELLEAFDGEKGYPLNYAAANGKVASVEFLLTQGANPNIGFPRTPLALAGICLTDKTKYLNIAYSLLNAGAVIRPNEFTQLTRRFYKAGDSYTCERLCSYLKEDGEEVMGLKGKIHLPEVIADSQERSFRNLFTQSQSTTEEERSL